jgi:hypothetical protein
VHFGELSPTAARLADARSAPSLPPYVPRPRPVQVAQVQPGRQVATEERSNRRDRRSRRQRERDEREQRAAAAALAARQPAPEPAASYTPPGQPSFAAAQPIVQPVREPQVQLASRQPQPAERGGPIAVRSTLTGSATSTSTTATPAAPPPARAVEPAPVRPQPTAYPAAVAAATPVAPPAPATPQPQPAAPETRPAVVTTLPAASQPGAPVPQPQPAAPEPAPVAVTAAPTPTASPAETAPAASPPPVIAATAARPEPTPPGPARVGQEDSVLASIVANITIPAEELEVVNAEPVDAPAPAPVRVAASPRATAAAKPTPAKAETKPLPKPAPARPDAKADAKAKKPDPKAKDPAKAEPARFWVQVAGGANADTLPKAWKAVVAKAPALKGRSAWWTPLRATNRLLAGPFKTSAEAQGFVNTLGKSGVSAFVFSSEAGQKINRLEVK